MKYNPILEGELANLDLLEHLYEQYQVDPNGLDPSWKNYFQSLDHEAAAPIINGIAPQAPSLPVEQLIDAYRRYGHLTTKINPIALNGEQKKSDPFDLAKWGLKQEDLSKMVATHGVLKEAHTSLALLIDGLRNLYCNRIGFEYKHVDHKEMEQWIQDYIETKLFQQTLSNEQKQRILDYLNRSELFETFLHTKYVGQKRFSLEGAETLIPMLAFLIEAGAEQGIQEFILGMAHRGRLNVLANILNKSYHTIFSEFDEGYIPDSLEGMGDVKYHKGYTGDNLKTPLGKAIKLILSPNPSHLESVDAVVEGKTRAKQFLANDELARKKIVPILIHGDAAVSGQGVVYETLQLAKVGGYTTGGTIHFVINNQIGFTTIPRDSRSTPYCTDIARAFGLPVFHVNAEDPDSCVLATLLALEIRQRFHCDVFIDLNGYRKYGHNEGDEPAYTQPLEYRLIKSKKSIRELYRNRLLEDQAIAKDVVEQMEEGFKAGLQEVYGKLQEKKGASPARDQMERPSDQALFQPVKTGVDRELLLSLAERFSRVPEGFSLHPKIEHLVKDRLNRIKEDKPIDWGLGEYLAYATLLDEEVPVRISGQDSCRGTFSHRHAIWVDQQVEKDYYPLAHLKAKQGKFEVVNSPLSEMAVLGFEYGYSVACLKGLTIWEAQFGDFANGAQVIIDQYIASGEQKWGQKSGLVMLLPHGYEGQGPEHSSARLERFLSLAGHDNMQVVNPTTPAQLFHLLRRQMHRSFHKPLIVFTPKGLLRHPACVSSLADLAQLTFQDILDDPVQDGTAIKRLVLCSGRLYYDLLAEKAKTKRSDIALIRIEQLYPLNTVRLKEILARYSKVKDYLWVQEEPQNMGAWSFISPYLIPMLAKGLSLLYVGRKCSATPATGSHQLHEQEHVNILKQVFQT